MDAKEILDLYLFTDNVEQFTEQLNAKLKEEAQERFNKAMSYYNNETYMNGETKRAVVNAIKLAAGIEGKEER